MQKTIRIDGRLIPFKSSPNIPLLYKTCLGRNFSRDLGEIFKIKNPVTPSQEELKTINFDRLFRICWIFAKNADKSLPPPREWERQFKSFPVFAVIAELSELILAVRRDPRGP